MEVEEAEVEVSTPTQKSPRTNGVQEVLKETHAAIVEHLTPASEGKKREKREKREEK